MNTITFESAIKKISTRVDGTLDIVLNSQELPTSQMAQLFSLKMKHCGVAICPHGEEVKPFEPATMPTKDKSPSQRLRAVLYVTWEQDKQGYDDFDQWYLMKMEQIINHYKDKLD
jgi:hypothetical protein|tara:strand:- start:20786 stop:21130 length:345 start_codon:yes stop_codon:yes gene_type:complete